MSEALGSHPVFSQTVPSTVGVHQDTLDAFAVQPFDLRPYVMEETMRVERNGTPVSSDALRLDAVEGQLWVRPARRLERSDTLVAIYRTFPLDLKTVYRRRVIASAARSPNSLERQDSTAAQPTDRDTSAVNSYSQRSVAADTLGKDASESDSLTQGGPLP